MSESRPKILVVEDEADIRRFVCLSLAREGGFEVFEADCVERGLVEAGTRRPDLVVLDLGLPDGDGVDLIRDLRTWSDLISDDPQPAARPSEGRTCGRLAAALRAAEDRR